MSLTRREFIQGVGLAAASLALLRCSALPVRDTSPRGRLRRAWLRLEWLARHCTWNPENPARQDLVAEHRAALDELVTAGELSPEVADDLHAAYDAAASHVECILAPITCYLTVMLDYHPASSEQLAAQADLLAEMTDQADLDPATVAQAQAAIERDIAYLSLSWEERRALVEPFMEAALQGAPAPPFDQLDLEINTEAREAASFLVDLLLNE
jgi:hypothetical protein